LAAFRVLTVTATVPAMQLEPTLALPHVVTRRRRLPLAVHAALASVAAAVVALLVAAPTAASGDLGSMVDGAVAALEPIVEPLEPLLPVVEPALEPITDTLEPITPLARMVPGLDGLPPLLERLDPLRQVEVPSVARTPTRPTPADAVVAIHALDAAASDGPPFADLDRVNGSPLVEGGGPATLLVELGEFFDAPAPLGGPAVDAGTTLAAAVLIGLSMAVAPGWATPAVPARLRPIGLTVVPPVPPG